MHPVESWRPAESRATTFVTCLGVNEDKFPVPFGGNCFSVLEECEPGAVEKLEPVGRKYREYEAAKKSGAVKEHRIMNFCYENFMELLRRDLTWPVRILVPRDGCTVIHDERIPHNWYEGGFCGVCTPRDLIPPQTRLRELRDIASGRRVETESGTVTCDIF